MLFQKCCPLQRSLVKLVRYPASPRPSCLIIALCTDIPFVFSGEMYVSSLLILKSKQTEKMWRKYNKNENKPLRFGPIS